MKRFINGECWQSPVLTNLCADDDGNETEQRMEFPNPPKPKEINHGDADGGFNFPGSAGFIWQASNTRDFLF